MNMIFSALDKLLEKAIKLAELKKKEDRHLFNSEIDPLFNDFQKIHTEYLNTFIEAQKQLTESTEDFPEIIKLIVRKYKISSVQREKLRALALSLQSKRHDQLVSDFTAGIFNYLTTKYETPGWMHDAQRLYRHLIDELLYIDHYPNSLDSFIPYLLNNYGQYTPASHRDLRSGKSKKDVAIKVLDVLIVDSQQQFGWVCRCYAELKNKLN